MKFTKLKNWLSTHIPFIIVLIIMIYPLYWILQLSLKTQVEALKIPPSWIFRPNFQNYIKLFESNFIGNFSNSFIISLFSTIFTLIFGIPAAYVFSRMRFKFKNGLFYFVLLSRMIPPITLIVPFFIVYVKLGLIDTKLGLILVYVVYNLGLAIWSLWTFFDEIPRELDEAAEVDGASVIQTLKKVILPVVTPGITSTAILCFINAWNDFFFALILARSAAVTAPVAISSIALAYESQDLGMMGAAAITVAFPTILFSIIMNRYFKRSIMSGAVKG